jgi:diguanylate cyclase (GGDEF)-like protein
VLNRRHRLRLAEVADRDDLTGLPNRRKIVEHAEHQFALERRRGGSLVIGMLDIDHFKQINDRHGHEGGDRVLRALGAAASGALRSTDTLGRWGGEEFLLVLPDCPPDAAAVVAERLRSLLAAQAVAGGAGEAGDAMRFSVSIGLAAATPGDATLQALVQRADSALYVAKAAGRDRVVFDDRSAVGHHPPSADSASAKNHVPDERSASAVPRC